MVLPKRHEIEILFITVWSPEASEVNINNNSGNFEMYVCKNKK